MFKFLLLILFAGSALAGEVGNYPNATTLNGTERLLSDQGGVTVDITPTQIEAWLFPLGYLPASLMPILTGDCSTSTGSYAITCTKTNGLAFSTLATAPSSSAIISYFAGCTGTYYLGADGNCHPPGSGGSVTSVGITVPSYLQVTNSPVTASGTIAITGTTLSGNQVLATPNGSAGQVAARALVSADLPLISLTNGIFGVLPASFGGTGESGTITGILKGNGTSPHTAASSGDVINLWTGSCTSSTFLRADGSCQTPPGTGTVSSIAFTAPTPFAITGSPITSTGTIALSFASGQAAAQFLASPAATTGAVSLRSIVATDLPAINLANSAVTGNLPVSHLNSGTNASSVTWWNGTGAWLALPSSVSSVGLTAPSIFTVTNSPIISNGNIALAFATGQAANQVLASPNGSTGAVGLRSLVAADIPPISLTTGVTGLLPVASGGTGETGITGILYGNGTSPHTVASVSNIISLFSGTCNSSTYLRGDGGCQTPATGSVTSVALTVPGYLTVTGSPITSAGTLAIGGASEPAGYVLAAPAASAGVLSPRLLVATDIPVISLSSGVSGTLQAAQEPAFTGDVTKSAGSLATTVGKINGLTIPVSATVVGTNGSGQFVSQATTGTGNNVLAASPSITNANLNTPSAITLTYGTGLPLSTGVTGILPVSNGGTGATTLTGILVGNGASAFSIATSANVISLWSGTCSNTTYLRGDGACSAISGSGSVTSVGISTPSWLTVSGSPVTTSGTIAITATSQSGNLFLASPDGTAGAPTFRAITVNDIPAQGTGTPFTIVTSNTTLSPTNTSVLVNASAGPIQITLPTAVGDGHVYIVKKIDSSANVVTVVTTSSQTIDGSSTSGVTNQYSSVSFKADNSGSPNWWIF